MKKYYSFLMCLFVALSSFLVSCGDSKKNEATSPANGHEYVDLGLPSGTMWATCNVGANNPWEYGGKYAWGETAEKKEYSWSTYQLCAGVPGTIKMYCVNGSSGRVDNKTLLESADDVAHKQWGGDWRMPTNKEFEELRSQCTWEWIRDNGVFGYKVTSKKNGNSIFLPASERDNFHGYYWSSSLSLNNSDCAYLFDIRSIDDNSSNNTDYRYLGYSVRPVFKPVKKNTSSAKNFTTINGHEYVDLGLPSGLKWATCNVGANNPWEDGGYYAWGETEEKENYDFETYKWCRGSDDNMTKYCTDRDYGKEDNKTVLDPEDDVAHVKWGGSWRMPTNAELDELCNNCTWTWTTQSNVNGYKVTGPNGNSIFLPAAGCRYGTGVDDRGSLGYCWSSSLCIIGSCYAYSLYFGSGYYFWEVGSRFGGHSVRPVSE